VDETTPAKEQREEFLTARQLAALLQVSESTVRRLAREGRIPSIRLTPRLTRFHLASVLHALDGNTSARTRPSTRRTDTRKEDSQLSFTDLL
jgi:excisionase family DNA binding protein